MLLVRIEDARICFPRLPEHEACLVLSSSKDRIAAAKADWAAGRFDKVFGDEEEFIPAPP